MCSLPENKNEIINQKIEFDRRYKITTLIGINLPENRHSGLHKVTGNNLAGEAQVFFPVVQGINRLLDNRPKFVHAGRVLLPSDGGLEELLQNGSITPGHELDVPEAFVVAHVEVEGACVHLNRLS